jgi:hypothetical protein
VESSAVPKPAQQHPSLSLSLLEFSFNQALTDTYFSINQIDERSNVTCSGLYRTSSNLRQLYPQISSLTEVAQNPNSDCLEPFRIQFMLFLKPISCSSFALTIKQALQEDGKWRSSSTSHPIHCNREPTKFQHLEKVSRKQPTKAF